MMRLILLILILSILLVFLAISLSSLSSFKCLLLSLYELGFAGCALALLVVVIVFSTGSTGYRKEIRKEEEKEMVGIFHEKRAELRAEETELVALVEVGGEKIIDPNAHFEETRATETPPVRNDSNEGEESDAPNSPTESVSSSTEIESLFGHETVAGESLFDNVQFAKMETDMHDDQSHDESVVREGNWNRTDSDGNNDVIPPNAESRRQKPHQSSPTSPDNTPLSPTQRLQLRLATLSLTGPAKRNNKQDWRHQSNKFESKVSGNMIEIPPVSEERDPRTGLYRGSVKRRVAIIDRGARCD